ncbi:MAG: hypothetical protein ACTSV7_06755 [Candidatus Baldrarchaeia archaeon]
MPGTLLKLSPEEIRAIEQEVEEILIKKALEQKIATRREDVVVRDILPATDFNWSYEYWQESVSASGYATTVSVSLPDTKIVLFYGAKNLNPNPKTAAIKFLVGKGGTKVKDIWQIEHAYTEENAAVYSRDYVIYNKSEHITIQQYGRGTAGTDNLILLGKVAEPRGETIAGGSE